MLLCFYVRHTLVPVFTNWKKFEEHFHFHTHTCTHTHTHNGKKKTKRVLSVCFCREPYRCSTYPCSQSGTARVLPQESHSASQHSHQRFELCLQEAMLYLSLFCTLLLRCVSFPGSSNDKESACNAGDLGSIPGCGRSPGEGNVCWL